jgi:Activator of Hsp90 ATPase homolog 1-like protein
VGRVWRARGSNNTVYSTGAKPTRVEGPADSDSPLIFNFQNDLSRLQQRFEVGQDARPAAGNRLHHETDWKAGSPWRLVFPDGRTADAGEILEVEPQKRLVIKWRNEFKPELKAEGYSCCTIALEPTGGHHEVDHHSYDRSRRIEIDRQPTSMIPCILTHAVLLASAQERAP